ARVSDVPFAQINVTPLVDVLLVLLVIFMITTPVLTHQLKLDLPQPGRSEKSTPPPSVHLVVAANGAITWNDMPISASALESQLAIAAHQSEPPSLAVDPADGASYQIVAEVIAQAKRQGIERIDFVASR
ncbi:MAG TPA: biopolymer transporter ExbD, partial [Dyella sp.]|uniref:ExbD/TolR family protein n=1 Tax=Dyella sp. TaxID=1869338 RepID=UPI002D767B8E